MLQLGVLVALVWIIAGNDYLFRSTVPIEQRLVSQNEPIRKRAQQELLGLDADRKRSVASKLIPALQQDNAFEKKWAAISLALIGPSAQQAIPFLLQCVSAKEKDVAQAARVALSEIGAPDAQQLPSLLRSLQDPRETVRCESAISIGKMGPVAKEAVPLLLGYLKQQDVTPGCFEEALASLASGVPSVHPAVIELLESGSVEVRRKAAHVLALSGVRTPETIQAVLTALSRDPDHNTRDSLAKALELPQTPEANPETVLGGALHASLPAVRLEAAKTLRKNVSHGRKSLPLILRMMRDQEPQVRRLGLEALRRSGQSSPEILLKVARAQRDVDPGVRCRAAGTLIESGAWDRVSTALLIGDLRRDDDTALCAENVLGLVGLFDEAVVYSMMHLVQQDKDIDVRSRAAHVLMHLGTRARPAIPALQRAREEKVPGADVALRAIRAPAKKNRK